MDRSKCRRRSSSKKYRFSSGDSTYCKPIIKNSSHNDDSSEGEIEFEGWIEFVTKKDKNENNTSTEKNKKSNKNRNSSRKLSDSANENILKNMDEKYRSSSKRTSDKNSINKNEVNSEKSYSSTNYIYKQPENITNNNMFHLIDNGQPALFINTQENRENTMNTLNPIYVDPMSPIVLKNQQLFPQLYVRQPPTVIVTNEQRPPLVINPPPANVIFKNQSPQPIYVNNARPNIIIKNDPPILQHPINMDTIPIQVDNASENFSVKKDFLKYPSSMNIKGESLNDNKNCYLKGNINTSNPTIPTNFIQLDNSIGEISHQTIPNIYVMNDTQCANYYQTQNSNVSPNNNIIHVQQNPAFNEYETNVVQNIPSPYPQVISQPEQNGNLLNQQSTGNPVMQIIPSPTVQTMTPTGVQVMPQTQHFESISNFQTPVTYENNYTQQVAHTTFASGTPQVIHQNPIPATTIVQEQITNNPSSQFRTIIPTNTIANPTNVMKFQSSIPQQMNVNKTMIQPSCSPSQVLSSCSPISCMPTNKFIQMPTLKRNTYVNPNVNPMYHSPKKVQIIARPMNDGNARGYNICR
ncbi:conserved Plasmodium protein, unknown function [Plasmodium gallinaceum]|uniref:Pv-fam-g protein n=1 Tax=Plasmodium gallinaceum TaxID=5849 RepID=A0A1J1GQD5_PLAGA|nr:conserved Plasmodium protein, unknown function [Plasmodium gallinaceum]CRG94749.1 conserved Plasmodium protein, unknown function [Plasmodium gallinaceum]